MPMVCNNRVKEQKAPLCIFVGIYVGSEGGHSYYCVCAGVCIQLDFHVAGYSMSSAWLLCLVMSKVMFYSSPSHKPLSPC